MVTTSSSLAQKPSTEATSTMAGSSSAFNRKESLKERLSRSSRRSASAARFANMIRSTASTDDDDDRNSDDNKNNILSLQIDVDADNHPEEVEVKASSSSEDASGCAITPTPYSSEKRLALARAHRRAPTPTTTTVARKTWKSSIGTTIVNHNNAASSSSSSIPTNASAAATTTAAELDMKEDKPTTTSTTRPLSRAGRALHRKTAKHLDLQEPTAKPEASKPTADEDDDALIPPLPPNVHRKQSLQSSRSFSPAPPVQEEVATTSSSTKLQANKLKSGASAAAPTTATTSTSTKGPNSYWQKQQHFRRAVKSSGCPTTLLVDTGTGSTNTGVAVEEVKQEDEPKNKTSSAVVVVQQQSSWRTKQAANNKQQLPIQPQEEAVAAENEELNKQGEEELQPLTFQQKLQLRQGRPAETKKQEKAKAPVNTKQQHTSSSAFSQQHRNATALPASTKHQEEQAKPVEDQKGEENQEELEASIKSTYLKQFRRVKNNTSSKQQQAENVSEAASEMIEPSSTATTTTSYLNNKQLRMRSVTPQPMTLQEEPEEPQVETIKPSSSYELRRTAAAASISRKQQEEQPKEEEVTKSTPAAVKPSTYMEKLRRAQQQQPNPVVIFDDEPPIATKSPSFLKQWRAQQPTTLLQSGVSPTPVVQKQKEKEHPVIVETPQQQEEPSQSSYMEQLRQRREKIIAQAAKVEQAVVDEKPSLATTSTKQQPRNNRFQTHEKLQEEDAIATDHEEKKVEETERVSVASMKARYGASSTQNGSIAATSTRASTGSSSKKQQPLPSYMKPTKANTQAKVVGSQEEAQVAENSSSEPSKKDVGEAESPWSSIETPGKVDVASMKARYGSTTSRPSAAPRNRSQTPTPPTFKSSASTTADNAPFRSVRSASAGRFRSDSPFADQLFNSAKAPASDNNKNNWTRSRSAAPSPEPTTARAQSPAPKYEVVEPTTVGEEDSRTGVESPLKVTVQSISSRFMQTTVSSAAKRSPVRGSGPANRTPPLAFKRTSTATEPEAEEAPVPTIDKKTPKKESCRSVIETPEPVSVASMKGVFGSSSDNKTNKKSGRMSVGSYSNKKAVKTPVNAPRTPPKRTNSQGRLDHSTPHAPLVPSRQAQSAPWRGRLSLDGRTSTTELPPPPWVRSDTEDDNGEGEKQSNTTTEAPIQQSPQQSRWRTETPPPSLVQSKASLQTVNTTPVSEGQNHNNDSPRLPRSPRDRPTNIPKWKQPKNNVISEELTWMLPQSRKTMHIPTLNLQPMAVASDDGAKDSAIQSEETIDMALQESKSGEKDCNDFGGQQQREGENHGTSQETAIPSSPRSRERPWKRDVVAISPGSWKRRMREVNETTKDKINGAASESPSSSQAVDSKMDTPTHQNVKTDRLSLLRQRMLEEEATFDEEKKSSFEDCKPLVQLQSQQPAFSLTQMAVDSIHAVDFERAMCDLKRGSVSQDEDESLQSNSGMDGTIPLDLPPEFAKALSKNPSKSKLPTKVAVRVVDATQSPAKTANEDGIVFGDPSTYGAAGGEVPAAPPNVADRARAIANWKGGLGVKPTKSGSKLGSHSEEDSDDPQPGVIEIIETTSSDQVYDQHRSKSVETDENKEIASQHSNPAPQGARGASSVLKFWSHSTPEVADEAVEVWRSDDVVAAPEKGKRNNIGPSSPKKKSSNQRKTQKVADLRPGSPSSWLVWDGHTATKSEWSPKENLQQASDPFSHVVQRQPTNNFSNQAAFDPFWHTGDDTGVFELDFFNAAIQVREEPFSPAPTDFSMPNFEPKASEDPAHDDSPRFGRALAAPSGLPVFYKKKRRSKAEM